MPLISDTLLCACACLLLALPMQGQAAKKSKSVVASDKTSTAVLWKNPADLPSRNLYYGPGGKDHQPAGTRFKFVDEDLDGSNPKYNVVDDQGVKWKVKLGEEAKPETAATRLVWAAGYFTNEDYFLDRLRIDDVPQNLHRGRNLIAPDGTLHNARLKRHIKGEENLGIWSWRDDPFSGTREWDGLRVLMALINNWDLKDDNNAIYEDKRTRQKIYVVKDLGASFGTTGYNPVRSVAKGNLHSYRHSHFISKVTPEYVDFATPSMPSPIVIFNPVAFFPRVNEGWIGKRLPRADARWMGKILARLSPSQIRDAFRASGYSPEEVEGFSAVVEKRIHDLNAL